ncbi:MAG: tripartite tricarboxylate transporter substrate binding protein, partial [Burkholderiales bacterium]
MLLAAAASAGPSQAQGSGAPDRAFPSRPVRIIVPAAAGGTLDIIARTLSQGMSEGFRQPVVVENRATSSTTVAEEYVA